MKQEIPLLLIVGRQVFSHPQVEGLHHIKWLHGNKNGVTLNVPTFLLLPPALIAESSPMVWNIPLASCRVCVPSSSLCTPACLLVEQHEKRGQKMP